MFKPRLLRETAEIALTEIKRFVELHLTDDFSLRRVSAPLYLPVSSHLNDPGEAVKFTLPGCNEEMEIVRGLDYWLRTQLVRYDIAPGFGVFTVMNALRPEVCETATQSPHLSAWAWQQTLAPAEATSEHLVDISKKLYSMMQAAEAMIIEKLPHLNPTLPQRIHTADEVHLAEKYPDATPVRREYQYLHDNPSRAILLIEQPALKEHSVASQTASQRARILVWNPYVKLPLCIAETAITLGRPIGSIGGNILRDPLAMQILHQPHLLR